MKIIKKQTKNNNGITLIALVITIIVLLILAGVSIAMLTGENGILTQAQNARNKTEEAEEKERIQLAITEAQLGDEGYQDLTEENLQKELDEEFGSGEVRVYPNEKNAFSFIFQNKEANYRLEKDGTLNKIDIALKIYDIGDFEDFVDKVNAGNTFENQYVYLMENMDLKNQEWNVIGSYTDDSNNQPFAGIFEGNNKKISGINLIKNQDYVGLFAYNTGTIRDIILESGSITGEGRVGGIIAVNAGVIENCHNKGTTINVSGVGGGGIVARSTGEITYCSNSSNIKSDTAQYIGGIVGALNYTKITNCYNIGSIECENHVGGIIGGLTDSIADSCYNEGDITGKIINGTVRTDSGGIVGGMNNGGQIINCYNRGIIKSGYVNGGGIVGQVLNDGEITNCYNVGMVVNRGEAIGNIAGSAYSGSKINSCYFSKEICNLEGVGVTNDSTIETTEKTINYMKTSSFIDDLNKDENVFIMDIGINEGYPILEWQVK